MGVCHGKSPWVNGPPKVDESPSLTLTSQRKNIGVVICLILCQYFYGFTLILFVTTFCCLIVFVLFCLYKMKSHLFYGYRTAIVWISPSTIGGISKESNESSNIHVL